MVSLIISITCIIALIISLLWFPRIKVHKLFIDSYWIVTLFFAFLLVLFNQVDFQALSKLILTSEGINPLKLIIIFLAMTLLSIYLDEVGLFKYLAFQVALKFQKSQNMLFLMLFLLISILTVFTSNDVVILTFTPFICYFCKNAKINPIPYLIGEFFAANTLSMALVIGNPTNMYLASVMNISFVPYMREMLLIGLLCALTLFVLLRVIFARSLKAPLTLCEEEVHISSRPLMIIGIIHLLGATICMALSSFIHVKMYVIALTFALSLSIITIFFHLLKHQKPIDIRNTYRRLPYQFIPFLFSMIIIVSSLSSNNVISSCSAFFGHYNSPLAYGIGSFMAGNLMNNIPMSIFFGEIMRFNLAIIDVKSAYAMIAASNLCALFTPLGSLAGMMFLTIIKQHNIKFSFLTFLKYSFVSVILLFLAIWLIIIM